MRRACFLLLLSACPMPPVARPYPPPSAEQLLQALQARRDKLTSLRAEGRADEMGQGAERVKVTINVLVQKGGKLRLEAESPLGGTVATLVTDGDQFQLLDVRNNRFLTGRAEPCNTARLVGVELPPEQVMTVVAGSAPIEGTPSGVSWDSSHGGRDVLQLKTPDGGSETLWLSNRIWDVAAAERKDASGKTLWTLTHEDFEDIGGFRFPKRTTIDEPPRKSDVRIRWKDREPNTAVKDGVFHLDPGGLKVEVVGCQ
jgi:outer membrane biogenesis lipoprotein LolB